MKRLILVDAAGLDWDRLHALVDDGRLPHFAAMINAGSVGAIDVSAQPLAVVWASMATGRLPSGHGIYGDMEARPDGGGIQPVGAASWRAAPVWRMLADHGVATAIVALPGTTPASAWPGMIAVDDRFAAAPPFDTLDWPLPPGCIEPSSYRERCRPLRLDPEDLEPDQSGTIPLRPLAYAATVHGLALELAERDDLAFVGVHLPGLGPSGDALRFLDAAVGRLREAAGSEANFVIVSTSGIFIACGPDFVADRLIHGMRAVDVAATLLAVFGFTLAEGNGVSVAMTRPEDAATVMVSGALEPRAQSVAPAASPDARPLIAEIERHRRRVHAIEVALTEGQVAAMPLLRQALEASPHDPVLRLMLGEAAVLSDDSGTCFAVADWFAMAFPEAAWSDVLAGAGLAISGDPAARERLERAASIGRNNPIALVTLGAIALRNGDFEVARSRYGRAIDIASSDRDRAQALAGMGLATLDCPAFAEQHLRAALGCYYDMPGVHHQLGLLFLGQKRWREAIDALRTAEGLSTQATDIRRDLHNAIAGAAKAVRLERFPFSLGHSRRS